jgi:hypothetical protein
MTPRKKKPSRGKRPRRPSRRAPTRGGKKREPEVVRLPVALLRRSGLDLRGVPVRGGRVSFEVPDDVLTGPKLLELVDIDFWNKLAVSSRQAAGERERQAKLDDAALEKLVAVIGQAASRRDSRAARQFARRVRLERAAIAKTAMPGAMPTPAPPPRMRRAIAEMRSIAVVKHDDKTYLLSTQKKKKPVVVIVVAAAGALGLGANAAGLGEFVFWGEVILELAMGVAAIMGAKINHNVKLGPWIEKLAELIKRNPRLTELLKDMATGRATPSAMMFLDLLWNIINLSGDWALDFLLAACDIGFWAGLYCLGKAIAKMSPGWGQVILAGEIAIVVTELIAKIWRHFSPPPPEEPGEEGEGG